MYGRLIKLVCIWTTLLFHIFVSSKIVAYLKEENVLKWLCCGGRGGTLIDFTVWEWIEHYAHKLFFQIPVFLWDETLICMYMLGNRSHCGLKAKETSYVCQFVLLRQCHPDSLFLPNLFDEQVRQCVILSNYASSLCEP